MKRLNNKFLVILLAVSVNSQAGIFGNYEDEGSAFRSSLNATMPTAFATNIDKKMDSKDAILYHLEKARILQVNQQYEESSQLYKKAFELLDKQNNRATVSASRLGFKALSMLSNDSIVPYDVPPYEQVLAHISQAKNYIQLNNAEAASVEMRVAQRIQREIEIEHEKELQKKSEKEKAKQENPQAVNSLDEAFAGLDPIAGRIKNTYQNAYAFYMAANLWEALGEYNDALVDYKKAYELQADSNIAKDVQRLDRMTSKNKDTVPVVVFIEQGIVPKKIENKLAIPVPNGIVNIAFATYEPSTYTIPKSLNVSLGDRTTQQSFVLNDIGALAVKELKERTVGNVSGQIVRATTKFVAQQQLGQHLGALGQLAGNLMNVATERADLRAWSTLPSNTQIARFEVKPGTHHLQISGNGTVSDTIQVNATANQTVFVYVNDVNNKISTSVSAINHSF